jgi:hypothetical protein
MGNPNFQNWSIDKGDYKRDETSTWTFQKKLIRKRRVKKTLFAILYIVSVSVITYLFLS